MKICVLQPDYASSDVDYQNYDPRRDLTALMPEAQVDHLFLNKLTTYKQLQDAKKQGYDIYVNLCEGYLEWDIPSIDVIHSLERLKLPYTGPCSRLYASSKPVMKYVAYTAGVKTPASAVLTSTEDIHQHCSGLSYPLFVKPAAAGDSLGIDSQSLVKDFSSLKAKVNQLLDEFDEVIVEEFVAGREFTVLVVGNADSSSEPHAYLPLEFCFPDGHDYKTYELKITEWHPECNVICRDPAITERLQEAGRNIFKAVGGVGYVRMDFRMDDAGEIYFLDANFECSVLYPEGYEGSADYILKADPEGQSGFLRRIVEEGLARHQKQLRSYQVVGNSIHGYGLVSTVAIAPGEVIWRGEERAQRIVTRQWVETHWSERQLEDFRRYAYPISEEVYILWDDDPSEWVPQNHSCAPNTGFDGLNMIALRPIAAGEELTLDYAEFTDERAQPFACGCGSSQCRGSVTGTPGNTLTQRLQQQQIRAE